jgi:hypothetical protein
VLSTALLSALLAAPSFAEPKELNVGVHAGIGFSPEVIVGGARLNLPLFRNVSVRPSAEIGWGEVTTFAALSFEGIYKFPHKQDWAVYVGVGPGMNFINRSGDREFSGFDFGGSLNVLTGVEFRNGMFVELKSSAYSGPTTRLLVGYNF